MRVVHLHVADKLSAEGVGWVFGRLHRVLACSARIGNAPGVAELEVLRKRDIDFEAEALNMVCSAGYVADGVEQVFEGGHLRTV